MASSEQMAETVNLPTLGEEGDACAQCGSVLAVDQRYCVNCGTRRAETRVNYRRQLAGNGAQPTVPSGGAATAAPQWSNPIVAIGAIAVLGVMLLLGVLIGNDNDGQQVVAGAAAPTVASTPTETTPADTTAAAPAAKKDAAATAPGSGNVVQGGSGSTEGVAAADTSKQGGGSVLENAKSGPDQVATQGAPEKLDPGGQAGGGSGATCIGC
jgi:uncharacterized OB-fold protein